MAGLEPWQVKRAYAALPPGSRGTIELMTTQWTPRLGRSLADVAERPRGLIEDRYRAADAALGFRPLAAAAMPESGGDFFAGLPLAPGGEARRQTLLPRPPAANRSSALAQRRRHTQAILDQASRDPRAALRLLAQTDDLTRGLDPATPRRLSIDWPTATRPPVTGTWRPRHSSCSSTDIPTIRSAGRRWSGCCNIMPAARRPSGPALLGRPDRRPAHPAAGWIGPWPWRQIARSHPDLFAHPAVRFPAAAAYRQQGLAQQAQHLYAALGGAAGTDAWSACARGELWLAQPKGLAPRPTLLCVQAPAKPRLDGRLDDAVWRRAKPVALRSSLHDDSRWPATVRLAHDEAFLYIAVECRQAPGARYDDAGGRRVRDADLRAHDRVDVLIDVDRDFATYYRLTIDHRGWTHDSCDGDSTWDPTWYVAARTEGGQWTAEAAVPLGELTRRRVTAETVWAVGLQRTVPGVGFRVVDHARRHHRGPRGFRRT